MILFDHRTCRIERFLVNNDPLTNIPYNNISPTTSIQTDQSMVNGSVEDYEHYDSINKNLFYFKDGKLTKEFIKFFIIHCIGSGYLGKNESYADIQDLRAISYHKINNPLPLYHNILNRDLKQEINTNKTLRINVNKAIIIKESQHRIKDIYNIKIAGVNRNEHPPVILELLKHINGRVFVNSEDLQRRVNMFNTYLENKKYKRV